MTDTSAERDPGFGTSPWNTDGLATLEAAGGDLRAALEAGLRAALVLAVGPAIDIRDADRSTPVRGEGDDAASLFADLVEDLLGQLDEFGNGLHDVAVDGVLRRGDGGYVAWGYANGTLEPAAAIALPRLQAAPTVVERGRHVVIRAAFRRSYTECG